MHILFSIFQLYDFFKSCRDPKSKVDLVIQYSFKKGLIISSLPLKRPITSKKLEFIGFPIR